MDIKKILIRAGSGLIYIALVTGLICCGYPGVLILAAIFTVLATVEFDHICRLPHNRQLTILICDILINLCVALAGGAQIAILGPLFLILLLARYVIELHIKNDNPLHSLSTSLMSIIYIALPMLCMNILSLFSAWFVVKDYESIIPIAALIPLWPILGIFILIWVNDTGAFLTGSLLGRHKLSPHISPKKTWEGFFGGVVLTAVAAGIEGVIIFPEIQAWIWVIYGILVSIFATWGDLTESLIKRNLGLKDSGHIMPGHGGILDRIDSLLFVMPLTLLLYVIFMVSQQTENIRVLF